MFRIDSEGSLNGKFQAENQATGTAGTMVSADWLNSVQEELIGIFVQMGGKPEELNKAKLDQVGSVLVTRFGAVEKKVEKLLTYVQGIYDTVATVKTFIEKEIGVEPSAVGNPIPVGDITIAESLWRISGQVSSTLTKIKIDTKIQALPEKLT